MRVRRSVIRAAAALLIAPPVGTIASGFGAPAPLAIAVAATSAVLGVLWARRGSPTTLVMSRAGFAGWVLLAALALAQDVRVSWFMADGSRLTNSAILNPFVIVHQCLSGYTEAARRALEGRENIYDDARNDAADGGLSFLVRRDGVTELYDQKRLQALLAGGEIPRVEIVHLDEFEYPPPFLLLPHALGALVGHDYFRIRSIWFGIQVLLLWFAFLISVRSADADVSTRAWAWLPAIWLAPPTLVGLQYGNFQTGVVSISVIAMAAFASRRTVAGATLLGFATLSKVFPGVLGAALIARQRWRAAGLTAIAALAIGLIALSVFGRKPFDDFFFYQLPAIASGSAFSFNNRPEWIPTNYGVYAAVAKLRLLGVPGMSQSTGYAVASAYGVLLLVFIVLLMGRAKGDQAKAIDSPIVWLTLLNLAAMRSPYVGDGYAQVGTLWLLALVVSQGRRSRMQLLAFSTGFVLLAVTFEGFAPAHPPAWMTTFSLVTQLGLIAVNLVMLLREVRGAPRPTPGYSAAAPHVVT
jgi:hypothetical protein